MDLQFTDTERLILANQYEILAKLDKDNSYALLAKQLRDGHEWLYRQSFSWVSPVMPESDAEFVLTIVGLYSDLLFSFNELADKGELTASQVQFPGFDGNDSRECELMGFARALIEAGRFSETLDGRTDLNSHYPAVPGYKKMIKRWIELGSPRELTKEQITAVLGAKRAD